MRYVVRTPDGELTYSSLLEVERAYVQGLVDPDDEVREEDSSAWRKAGSLPVLARARRSSSGLFSGRGQALLVGVAVLVGTLALVQGARGAWHLSIILALAVSWMLAQVTFKAFKRRPPRS